MTPSSGMENYQSGYFHPMDLEEYSTLRAGIDGSACFFLRSEHGVWK